MAGEAHSIFYEPVNKVWRAGVDALGLQDRFGETDVPEHVVMAIFVFALVCALTIPLSRSLKRERPGKLQQLFELLVKALYDLLESTVGPGGSKHLPLLGSFALFIFLSNLSGAFFFLQPPTQNVNTTFALAITACVLYHLFGLRNHGLKYYKHFLGPVPWLIPLFVPLEIITHASRVLSLGMRLFGNVFGEHLAVGIFFSLVPFLVPLPMMALGLLAAMLQTFIFVMLTTFYIAEAESHAH